MKTKMVSRAGIAILAMSIPVSCGYHDPHDDHDDTTSDEPPTDVQASTLTTVDQLWWRGLSQNDRNQVILDRTSQDIGNYVGLNCKLWVQNVVSGASRHAASVPPTSPDANGWVWTPNAYAVRVYANINTAQPGWIVQMNRRNSSGGITPHTAIVVGRSSYGIYWVDSNYAIVPDNVVRLHSESFADFDRATYISGAYRYSMYYVSGG